MSLEKAIKAGKTKRKPYRGSAWFDRSCRTGGSCGYCRNTRTFGFRKLLQKDPEV